MNTLSIILTIIALVVGVLIGIVSKKSEIDRLCKERDDFKNKNDELTSQIQTFATENSTNKAKLEIFSEVQKLIKEDFTAIANKVIKEEQSDLREQNREALDEKLKPLKENFEKFKEKVEEFNKQGDSNTATLKTQIETLMKENLSVKNVAIDLSNAIKNNSQVRGVFGEMILENLLQQAGLTNKNDDEEKGNYITQQTYKDVTSPTQHPRPDAVVFFPDKKNIIIDSKCPLNNFLEFSNQTEENEKQQQLKLFYNSVSLMIEELSGKYNTLEGLNTPEFKLMFIPLEACASYIYSNKDITDKATKQNIIIVCPSTLLATLKIINKTWIQKNQAENLDKILKTATSTYEALERFTRNAEDVKTKITSLDKSYEKLLGSIKGRQGFVKKIETLKELGIPINKKIDEKYLTEIDEEEDSVITEE